MIKQAQIKKLLFLLEDFAMSGSSASSDKQLAEDILKGRNLIISKQEQKLIHQVQCVVFDCLDDVSPEVRILKKKHRIY